MRINPVYRQESRTSARSFRLPLIIFSFNTVLAVVAFFYMYSLIERVRRTAELLYSSFLNLYIFVAAIEFVLLLIIIPAMTSGSISGEKERKTLDIMLTTQLKAADVVIGKLMSCLTTAVVLIISSFPVLSLVFIYGGVGAGDIALLMICYASTALLTGCIGIFCSSCFERTTFSTVTSYLIVAAIVMGTLVVRVPVLLMFNPVTLFGLALEGQTGMHLPFNMGGTVLIQVLTSVLLLFLAIRNTEPVRWRKAKSFK